MGLILEKTREDVESHCPFKIIEFASRQYPRFALVISESVRMGDPWEVCQLEQGLPSQPGWQDQLTELCTKLGIEYTQPEWLLLTYFELRNSPAWIA